MRIQGLESDLVGPFWATEEAEGAGAEWVWEEWQEVDSGGEGGQKRTALGAKLMMLNVL